MTLHMSAKVEPKGIELVYDKRKLKNVLLGAGYEISSVARKLIRTSASGGRVYRGPGRGKTHESSAPGQAPADLTGALQKSIRPRVAPSGQYMRVTAAFYGLFLEFGARGGVGSFKKGVKGQANKRARGARGANRGVLLAVAGARVLQPRPFLTTALSMRESSIAERIRESLAQDIAFRKIKP